jgi:ligand-binding sensor domain-containing protein
VSRLDQGGIHSFTAQNGLVYNSIRSLLEDRDGTIWIGTEHGLSEFRNGEFNHDAMTAALGDEKIWALHQDVDGEIWIGTRSWALSLSQWSAIPLHHGQRIGRRQYLFHPRR